MFFLKLSFGPLILWSAQSLARSIVIVGTVQWVTNDSLFLFHQKTAITFYLAQQRNCCNIAAAICYCVSFSGGRSVQIPDFSKSIMQKKPTKNTITQHQKVQCLGRWFLQPVVSPLWSEGQRTEAGHHAQPPVRDTLSIPVVLPVSPLVGRVVFLQQEICTLICQFPREALCGFFQPSSHVWDWYGWFLVEQNDLTLWKMVSPKLVEKPRINNTAAHTYLHSMVLTYSCENFLTVAITWVS